LLSPRTKDCHPGLQYLRGRGISLATARAAKVGWIVDYHGLNRVIRSQVPLEELQALRLFNPKGNFSLYKYRLLFPFWLGGEVLGLLARNPEWRSRNDGPKELVIGSPLVPYNADALTDKGSEVFLCEGAIDTLTLLEIGLNAVGVPGADGFKRAWVCLFDGFTAVIAFDADDAGRRGAKGVTRMFPEAGRPSPKVLELPRGVKDINEWWLRFGSGKNRTGKA
jgi:DNA primase